MPKHSILKSVSKEFQHIVQNSEFLSDILKHFGLSNKGTGNYNTLHRVLQEYIRAQAGRRSGWMKSSFAKAVRR